LALSFDEVCLVFVLTRSFGQIYDATQHAQDGWVLEFSGVQSAPTTIDPTQVKCQFRCLAVGGCRSRTSVGNIARLCQTKLGLIETTLSETSVPGPASVPNARVNLADAACPANHAAASGYPAMLASNFSHGGFVFSSALSSQSTNGDPATDTWTKELVCASLSNCPQTQLFTRTLCLATAQVVTTGDYFPQPTVVVPAHTGSSWSPTVHRFTAECPPGKFLVGGGCGGDPGKKIFPVSSFPGSNFEWMCDFQCWMGGPSCDGLNFNVKVHAVCATCPLCLRTSATTGSASTTGVTTARPPVLSTGTPSATSGTVVLTMATTGRPIPPHEFVTNDVPGFTKSTSILLAFLVAVVLW
jgi:hypothetical protein